MTPWRFAKARDEILLRGARFHLPPIFEVGTARRHDQDHELPDGRLVPAGGWELRIENDFRVTMADEVLEAFYELTDEVQVCQGCGCWEDSPCPGSCGWAAEDLCTACLPEVLA